MRPRVLDADGVEIRDGVTVERHWPAGKRGGVHGTVLATTKLDVLVEWPSVRGRPHGQRCFYKPERHALLGRTFTCSDLIVVPQPNQEGT